MRPTRAELALLHELVDMLTSRAAPVRFCQAKSQEQKSEIYAHRYSAIMSRGWAGPSAFPDGAERDAFDKDAIHILGRFEQSLVASARIVLPRADRPLPVEASHGIELEPRGEYVEIGRTIVTAADARLPRNYLFSALLGYALHQMLEASYFCVAAAANRSMLRLYRRLGIEVAILGPALEVWGEKRFPVSIDVLSFAREVKRSMDRDASLSGEAERPHRTVEPQKS
jgi:N-acyl-L-homoserine lactone synthetase